MAEVVMSVAQGHPVELDDEALLAACDVRRQRRSGPGGQHRNKVETGVFLTHRESGCAAQATEARSQAVNRRRALFRLRLELARTVRSERGGVASPRWSGRVTRGRMRVSASHNDFPPLLAEALDAMAAAAYDLPVAAAQLSVTGSQLARLLGQDAAALAMVNRERGARGLRRLL